MDLQDEYARRTRCLELAQTNESDPDQIIIDAEKFLLFLEGKPQVTDEDEPDRG